MGSLTRLFRKSSIQPYQYQTVWSKAYIPTRTGSSLWYYEYVRSYLKNTDLGNKYRLFMIPGVGHCSGGPGTDAFGGPGQRSASQGGNGQSLSFDAQHDMILATMQWVEKGVAPKSLISAKYVASNRTMGTAFTRLLCPYPQVSGASRYEQNNWFLTVFTQEGVYKGGDMNESSSYRCEASFS